MTIVDDFMSVHNFTDYVFLNYINIDSAMFLPEIWAELLSSSISRTTNDFESYHSKLNFMFCRSHSNQLIEVLNEVRTSSYTKTNCTRNLK